MRVINMVGELLAFPPQAFHVHTNMAVRSAANMVRARFANRLSFTELRALRRR